MKAFYALLPVSVAVLFFGFVNKDHTDVKHSDPKQWFCPSGCSEAHRCGSGGGTWYR